jgi:hypothetical protein
VKEPEIVIEVKVELPAKQYDFNGQTAFKDSDTSDNEDAHYMH